MEKNEQFRLAQYMREAEELLKDTQNAYTRLALPMDKLPASMKSEKGPIKLVFVGQYSAGKSSLIKMLTGEDIGIGASIKTDRAQAYAWNDMEIVDTPGIATGIRPDHDEKTYEEINHASLLIYVITNEGFDSTMGENFRKLAFEGKRSGNIVLVVNKMERAAQGNSAEQQDIMLPDLQAVIAPLKPEDVYLSFTSVGAYDEAQEEADAEIRQELMAESGYAGFIRNLNAFVQARGLGASLSWPLYTLADALKTTLGVPVEIQAMDDAEEMLRRQKRILEDVSRNCAQEIQDIALLCQSDINRIGLGVRSLVSTQSTEQEVKTALESAAKEVEQRTGMAAQEMQQAFEQLYRDLDRDLNHELESSFAKKIAAELKQLGVYDPEVQKKGDLQEDAVKALQEVGDKLADISGNSAKGAMQSLAGNAGRGAMQAFAGQAGRGALQAISGGAGIWGAANASLRTFSGAGMRQGACAAGGVCGRGLAASGMNASRNIGSFGQIFGLVGVGLSVYDMIQGNDQAKKAEAKVQEMRESLKKAFEKTAQDVFGQMMENGRKELAALVTPERTRLEEALAQFANRKEQIQQTGDELSALLVRTNKLLQEVNADTSVE